MYVYENEQNNPIINHAADECRWCESPAKHSLAV